MFLRKILTLGCVCLLAGMCNSCPPTATCRGFSITASANTSQQAAQLPPIKRYKRKVVIGRFTNETNYGRALLSDAEYDHMGKQASDMLATRLIQSNRFLVLNVRI